jgi:hypothetical protein
VIQVVLNRVRHPAFPADICSVVFQGSERATGCQFSFTCDGSMARRRPSGGQWLRAQAAADRALSGFVDPRVGVATHYHTDWVVAYWSPKMEKLARVGTHLFFRWPGSYGRPRAFTRSGFAAEVPEQRMAGLSPAHALAVQSDKSLQPVDVAPRAGEAGSGGTTDYAARGRNFPQEYAAGTRDLKAQRVLWSDPPGQKFVLLLAPSGQASSYALTALALCRGKPQCEVLATHDPAANPAQLAAADRSDLAFRYRRSAGGGETAQWDCHLSPRPSPAQCL